MNHEAMITVLLKRVHNLEHSVSHLIVAVREFHRIAILSGTHRVDDAVYNVALTALQVRGVPFQPDCKECKVPLNVIMESTKWETFVCPKCESWFFPNV